MVLLPVTTTTLILTFAAFISETESITLFTVDPRTMGFAVGVAVGVAVNVAVSVDMGVAGAWPWAWPWPWP